MKLNDGGEYLSMPVFQTRSQVKQLFFTKVPYISE